MYTWFYVGMEDINVNTGHGAVAPFAGFDYQFFYFFLKCLEMMEEDDTVSFELYDDVGMVTAGGIIYFQLKHTINTRYGHNVNLTQRDSDLWKTISTWIDIVKKQDNGVLQKKLIDSNEFHLVTNKDSCKNDFCKAVLAYQNEEKTFEELNAMIKDLYENTKTPNAEISKSSVKTMMKLVLDFPYTDRLLKKVHFSQLSDEEIITKIKSRMLDVKMINKDHVDEVYKETLGALKDNMHLAVQAGQSISYNLKDFNRFFRPIANKYRGNKFNFRRDTCILPDNPFDQVFIQQLMAVGDISKNDVDDYDNVMEYTRRRLDFENNLIYSLMNSDLSRDEYEDAKHDAKYYWERKSRHYYDGISDSTPESVKNSKGRELLDDIRDKILKIGEELDEYQSNGCFYMLSDGNDPQIGWHYNWKQKFKHHE